MYENQFLMLFAWVVFLGLATSFLVAARAFRMPVILVIRRHVWLIALCLWSLELAVCWAALVTLLKWQYLVPHHDDSLSGPEFHYRMCRAVLEMILLSVWLLTVMALTLSSSPALGAWRSGGRRS
jgi:hypothetical protein